MIVIEKISLESNIPELVRDIDSAQWSLSSEINVGDYKEEDVLEYIKSNGNLLCVAYLEGSFAGMAAAYVLTRPEGERWLFVDAVDTVEDKQKKGVGTSLMRYLIQYGQDNLCKEIWVSTEVGNRPANALYQSLSPDDISNFVGFTFAPKD